MAFVNARKFAELEKRVKYLEDVIDAKFPDPEYADANEVLAEEVADPEPEDVKEAEPGLEAYYDSDLVELLQEKFPTVKAVLEASDDELLEVKGIGPATVKRIRNA